ncbi:unnamed protein product [Callosobruchus maculatus]|uniref:H15 domain-containing protein n=1 Tax=Callosobruchus maculatus TaxID=64391 RepID=A0A653BID8_CALMS|nr:unnamed protein product [Callosobruchus maculatus]
MKRKSPLFFPGILKAISQLQKSRGTTEAQILDYVQRLMLVINPSPTSTQRLRNVPKQVKSALKHATKLGLVKQKGGRYLLTIDQLNQTGKPKTNFPRVRTSPRTTALTIKTRTLKTAGGSQPDKACPHCRKGRRRRTRARRGRSRRRRRTHRAAQLDDNGLDSKESLGSDSLTL